MTAFPLDLVLQDGWSAGEAASALGAAHPGQPLLLILRAEAAIDAAAFEAMLAARPDIAGVTLRIGGTAKEAARLAEVCRARDLPVTVDLLPAAEGVEDCVIKGTGPLAGLAERTGALVRAGCPVRWLLPLTPGLVYGLEFLTSLARDCGAEPVVLPAAATDPEGGELTGDDRLFAWDFVTYRLLGEEIGSLPRSRIALYRRLRDTLTADGAAEPAAAWGVLDCPGDMTGLPRVQGALAAALLTPAAGDDRGLTKGEVLGEKLGDVADVLGVGVPAHLRASVTAPAKPAGSDPSMPFVLLIGAYGGEHIGDAAILGGVLHRIHARHGTTRAILMTQRPYHTRHLIPMLEVPVAVEVQEYTPANIRAALRQVAGVVFAGGPLTDLPKQLVRHLETVTRAKRRGLPFVMEGIGPGTFPRKPSAVTARRLVKLADRISIRVRDDAGRAVIEGCEIEIGRDPAFDYLETRGEVLTRLPGHEPAEIDALLAGTEGRPLIGINVRPIGSLFTEAPEGRDPEEYTREVEDRFEREFAEGLNAYAQASGADPVFVFFPMNAIQFGMSDLRSAWRIMQHLAPGTDFRVWQADASLDGVVALLRRMDTVISMRFHGAIFALAQGRQVIGIDYRIGKRDKVAAVLADAGCEENCARIDELRAGWLAGKLTKLTPGQTLE